MKTIVCLFAAVLFQVSKAQVPDWTHYDMAQKYQNDAWFCLGLSAAFFSLGAWRQSVADTPNEGRDIYVVAALPLALGVTLHIGSGIHNRKFRRINSHNVK